jgi:cupin fold WbuC family metalloprotein
LTALQAVNDQVLVSTADVTVIGSEELERVKRMALASPTGSARICAHPSASDPLHEMLIALVGGRFIRPHAHRGKSESFHMIEGALTIVLFDDAGEISRLVDLSARGREAVYYRLATPTFHTVVPRTPLAVFHETTNGPFDRRDALFPDWAPDGSDPAAGRAYLDRLLVRIGEFAGQNRT